MLLHQHQFILPVNKWSIVRARSGNRYRIRSTTIMRVLIIARFYAEIVNRLYKPMSCVKSTPSLSRSLTALTFKIAIVIKQRVMHGSITDVNIQQISGMEVHLTIDKQDRRIIRIRSGGLCSSNRLGIDCNRLRISRDGVKVEFDRTIIEQALGSRRILG